MQILTYREQIDAIRKKYGDMTFAEFERINNITTYSYEQVGYGYRLKATQPHDSEEATKDLADTPLMDELEKLGDAILRGK